jgi:hypothetical protein
MSDSDDNVVPLKPEETGLGFKIVAGVQVPDPPPGSRLDRQARRIYEYLCVILSRDGRNVQTAAVHLVMLTYTIHTWSQDLKLCLDLGRYRLTDNGNRVEQPHSYNERNGRAQIMKDLPEACLTVMSNIEARLKESKSGSDGQDDLFDALVSHGKSRPAA